MPESGGIDRSMTFPEMPKNLDEVPGFLIRLREAIAAAHDDVVRRVNELNEICILPFYQDDTAANQADVELLQGGSQRGFIAAEDGSIITLAVRTNDPRTGGSLVVRPTVNGVAAGAILTLDVANTTFNYYRQDQGVDTFVAGDRISCTVTTDAGWLPVTADIDVSVGVVFFKGIR
jgi:hypothetical protein